MRSRQDFEQRVAPYRLHSLYVEGVGNIAWMYGTGDNVEMLFLEAEPGQGREMYRRAVAEIERVSPTYHSLYAFTRTDNKMAVNFYTKMGWRRHDLGQSIYRSAETTLFSIPLAELKKVLGV